MAEQEVVAFKRKLQLENRSGLVLDIDETLSWTIGYWVKEMQHRFGNPENLSVRDLIKKYRYTRHVPYWQTEEVIQWVIESTHSNELQEQLPLVENAQSSVKRISEIVPIVGYITVRPTDVIPGTKNWLRRHKFPEGEIIAKPDRIKYIDGNEWKAGVLYYLYPEVKGIVDDNPLLVKYLPADYKGTVYLYDNEETERRDIQVYPCKTWKDVHAKVKFFHAAEK